MYPGTKLRRKSLHAVVEAHTAILPSASPPTTQSSAVTCIAVMAGPGPSYLAQGARSCAPRTTTAPFSPPVTRYRSSGVSANACNRSATAAVANGDASHPSLGRRAPPARVYPRTHQHPRGGDARLDEAYPRRRPALVPTIRRSRGRARGSPPVGSLQVPSRPKRVEKNGAVGGPDATRSSSADAATHVTASLWPKSVRLGC